MQDGRIVADDTVSSLLDMFGTKEYRIDLRNCPTSVRTAINERFPQATIDARDERTIVRLAVDSDGLYHLMNRFQDAGARIVDIATDTPDMKEAFVEVTGGE
ncbi:MULTISPECIES: hypothetical protein [Halomicrobium]|uniref:ABC transporter ATP-binding protein n=2 Tax=Halomicrobium mukohataei TaxID=57705 RepID=C7P0L8_HALMD|nr:MULTISPECIES: hypothetical protein [Halomicrobium]ACV47000.1 ABC transporter ATP-binding protein [Halomicrobium mukohataei DSM 12286]QCD65494.1 hypothetical protein E5139_07525 [Halomicrobium mukohataei]QFR20300.1 hypothetical protein GBQ70_07520 [Halomicrobium sp. ZPS1]